MRVPLLAALLAASLSVPAPAQIQVQEPEFVPGDLADLTCNVTQVGDGTEYDIWLVVEVKNRGDAAAEPLSFRIELPPAKRGEPARTETFQRTLQPRTRRFGRPVAPGGAQKYWLSTSLLGKRNQYRVAVEDACWHRGAALEAPEGAVPDAPKGAALAAPKLVAGDAEQVQMTSMAGTFPVTRVPLANPFDRDVDALFLVTFKQPRDTVALLGVRVPANGRLAWNVTTLPPVSAYLDTDGLPGCAMKAVKFELVDWSFVGTPDPAAGLALFAPAYEAWLAWPQPFPEVTGSFVYTERTRRLNSEEYDEHEIRGRFTLRKSGGAAVEVDSGTGANPNPWIAAAFADLRRKDPGALKERNTLTDLGGGRVLVHGPGFRDQAETGSQLLTSSGSVGLDDYPWYRVEDGRITGQGRGERLQDVWETRDLGRGYVVTARRSPDGSNVERFSYAEVGGLLLPLQWVQLFQPGGNLNTRRALRFTDLKLDAADAVQPKPPAGPGADALRAIWEQGYRYPTEPLEVTGEVEVTTPGTDMVWIGLKKVQGRVTMHGIGRSWRDLALDVAGNPGADTERTLAGALHDRLLMWYGRDPTDRVDFDAYFEGATIEAPSAQGEFRVTGGPVEAVVVRDGQIAAFVLHGGLRRTFTYAKVGERSAVTEITTGEEVVRITLAEVDGHVVPVKLRFERVFGRDWGPETIAFKNLRIR